ncbi:hypothetical protein BJ166DRAFT_259214 [Pestalotiopsis sp. NC0098]|nr:hypothetical protein BJ166DRAFT_259214 [Pestalotiopsis sp. NC0098]
MAPVNHTLSTLGTDPEGPGKLPPDGTTPNFENPPNRNAFAVIVYTTMLILTTIFAILRIYSRIITRMLTLPDVLGLMTFALYLGFVYVSYKHVESHGAYIHIWDIRLKDLPAIYKLFYTGTLLYLCIVLLIKAAILLEWASIFVPAGTRNGFFWASHAVLAMHLTFFLIMIVFVLVNCSPLDKNWNPIIPGKCFNPNPTGTSVAVSVFSLTFDIIIFLLPQRVVWKLQMSRQKKIGVSALFGIGLLACSSSSFRFAASIEFYKSRDTTYTFSSVALRSLGEATGGFIVFCGPAVPKAIEHLSSKNPPDLGACWHRVTRRLRGFKRETKDANFVEL